MLTLDATTLLSVALLLFAGWPGSPNRSRWIGRLLVLILLSPGLRYFSALFSFPIRLQLSTWSGHLLRLAGFSVQTKGNVLVKNGVEMAVDPACMGLQLTGVSLLLGLFFLIWQERQTQTFIAFGWVVAYAAFVFGLTVLCNLFRITLLVAFGSLPGTAAHEGIGPGLCGSIHMATGLVYGPLAPQSLWPLHSRTENRNLRTRYCMGVAAYLGYCSVGSRNGLVGHGIAIQRTRRYPLPAGTDATHWLA